MRQTPSFSWPRLGLHPSCHVHGRHECGERAIRPQSRVAAPGELHGRSSRTGLDPTHMSLAVVEPSGELAQRKSFRDAQCPQSRSERLRHAHHRSPLPPDTPVQAEGVLHVVHQSPSAVHRRQDDTNRETGLPGSSDKANRSPTHRKFGVRLSRECPARHHGGHSRDKTNRKQETVTYYRVAVAKTGRSPKDDPLSRPYRRTATSILRSDELLPREVHSK